MLAYSEVSELWFVAVLVISVSTPSTDGSHKLRNHITQIVFGIVGFNLDLRSSCV